MEPEGFKREPCYGEMLEWSLGGMQNPIRLLGGMQNSSWLKERLDVVAGVWEACERPSGASVAMGALRLGSHRCWEWLIRVVGQTKIELSSLQLDLLSGADPGPVWSTTVPLFGQGAWLLCMVVFEAPRRRAGGSAWRTH